MGNPRCFVISPIGDAGTPTRRHADDLFDHIIRPALETFDVEVRRADQISEPGRISDQMFRELFDADFCLAVLTGHNPNVFYEIATAQAAGKAVIFLADASEPIPFDVLDMRSIRYERDGVVPGNAYVATLQRFVGALKDRSWKGESLLGRYSRLAPGALLPSLAFETLVQETQATLARLTDRDCELLLEYREQGDGQRLFDGLYANALYASRAALTGVVEAAFYGNLMELDAAQRQLRVRYFAGPYNDEVITRVFPLTGRGLGVATRAYNEQKVKIDNSMVDALKVQGESRLQALICVPIPGCGAGEQSRQVVLLNIDSCLAHVFPTEEAFPADPAEPRVSQLRALLAEINALYRWIVEGAAKPVRTPQG